MATIRLSRSHVIQDADAARLLLVACGFDPADVANFMKSDGPLWLTIRAEVDDRPPRAPSTPTPEARDGG